MSVRARVRARAEVWLRGRVRGAYFHTSTHGPLTDNECTQIIGFMFAVRVRVIMVQARAKVRDRFRSFIRGLLCRLIVMSSAEAHMV